jgi:dihydropyrimidine dehydrogenase (NAD+) subunit PreA
MRAFDAGWGGAVWKTLGQPIQNVSSRFGAVNRARAPEGHRLQQHRADHRPPLDVNFREIYEVKKNTRSTR